MSVSEGLVITWAASISLAWCAAYVYAFRHALHIPLLSAFEPCHPDRWPRLSVIVAARDEASHLEQAVTTLLAQDYPDLEVVLVDDRSGDGTDRRVEALGRHDPRVRGVLVRELPRGWLGKTHALHTGARAATGEWLLFTDADVHFKPGVLKKAVAWSVERGLDHFAVAPGVIAPGFWLDVTLNAFAGIFLLRTGALTAAKERSKSAVGVGAFNLVRKAVFDRTPGFEWLRMEVLDDVGLGLMMKRAGGRAGFAFGLGEVEIAWYPSLGAMARGLEKNFFGSVGRYRIGRVLAFVILSWAWILGPVLTLVLARPAWLRPLGAIAFLLLAFNATVLRWKTGRPFLPLVLAPAGHFILTLILIRSTWTCWRRGGILWRGTFYSLEGLRSGQRVKL